MRICTKSSAHWKTGHKSKHGAALKPTPMWTTVWTLPSSPLNRGSRQRNRGAARSEETIQNTLHNQTKRASFIGYSLQVGETPSTRTSPAQPHMPHIAGAAMPAGLYGDCLALFLSSPPPPTSLTRSFSFTQRY